MSWQGDVDKAILRFNRDFMKAVGGDVIEPTDAERLDELSAKIRRLTIVVFVLACTQLVVALTGLAGALREYWAIAALVGKL